MKRGTVGGLSLASAAAALLAPSARVGSFGVGDRAIALGQRAASPSPGFGWLFATGRRGAWYDPSDRATLFQDLDGTQPVTAFGQPVGVMLDKSGTGAHMTAFNAARRPVWMQDNATGAPYLNFDGIDDGMVTPSIDWGAAKRVTVCAAIEYRGSASAVILNLGFGSNAVRTWFARGEADGFSMGTRMVEFSRSASWAGQTLPLRGVYTGRAETAANEWRREVRWNGVVRAANTGTASDDGFLESAPLRIGQSASVSPINGRLYQLVLTHGDWLSASGPLAVQDPRDPTLFLVEQYMAATMGMTL
jgi:hypothetical protein